MIMQSIVWILLAAVIAVYAFGAEVFFDVCFKKADKWERDEIRRSRELKLPMRKKWQRVKT